MPFIHAMCYTDYNGGLARRAMRELKRFRSMGATKVIGRDISLDEFDRMFDDGENVLEYFDMSTARQPGLETQQVNFDLPAGLIDRLDRHAKHLGVSREALIARWIAEKVRQHSS